MKGIAIYPALVMPALVTRDLVHRRRMACYYYYFNNLTSYFDNYTHLGIFMTIKMSTLLDVILVIHLNLFKHFQVNRMG